MLETLTSFVTVLLALSVASERLVELVKGMFPSLNGQKPEADVERKRQLIIHWMSLGASFVVVFLAQDYIIETLHLGKSTDWSYLPLGPGQFVVFSILSSGGSSVWNSILTYLLSLKNLKRQDAETSQKVGNTDLAKSLPSSMPSF